MEHIHCKHCGRRIYDGETVLSWDAVPDIRNTYCIECADAFLDDHIEKIEEMFRYEDEVGLCWGVDGGILYCDFDDFVNDCIDVEDLCARTLDLYDPSEHFQYGYPEQIFPRG